MVGEAGFGPAKSVTTDLQSAPFGRSGIPPYGAGERSRTINLLITNQLLCHWATPAYVVLRRCLFYHIFFGLSICFFIFLKEFLYFVFSIDTRSLKSYNISVLLARLLRLIELAKIMQKCTEEDGYGGWIAYRHALQSMGVKIDWLTYITKKLYSLTP